MELILLALVMNLALSTVDWNHRPRGVKAHPGMTTNRP